MTEELATEILDWKYMKPYDFYNNELTSDVIREMLDNPYYAVSGNNDELVGFFCMGKSAQVPVGDQFEAYNEDMIDIGFGMKPEFTGQGNGKKFLAHILRFIQESFPNIAVRLTVATFNKRAIHLYDKFGFVKKIAFQTDSARFITMVKETEAEN